MMLEGGWATSKGEGPWGASGCVVHRLPDEVVAEWALWCELRGPEPAGGP